MDSLLGQHQARRLVCPAVESGWTLIFNEKPVACKILNIYFSQHHIGWRNLILFETKN